MEDFADLYRISPEEVYGYEPTDEEKVALENQQLEEEPTND